MFKNPITDEIREKATDEAVESTRRACDDHRISLISLLTKLKSELNWKETKTMKVKGLVRQDQLPKGFKVIATSGTIIRDNDGNETASDGETVIMWQERSGGIRQKARMDAHNLRGDYPAKELKHSGGIDLRRPLTPEEEEYLREAMDSETETE